METHCGYIAIVGRPNVGKSTLLNQILGQKISITARKPQTTRHKILGIKTENNIQAIYVDTPGLHKKGKHKLSRFMMREVRSALTDVNVIVFVVDGFDWKAEDQVVLDNIVRLNSPIILAVNKVDLVKNKDQLLPYLEMLSEKYNFAEIIPLSAKKGFNVVNLEQAVAKLLPKNPFYFAKEQITDKSVRFLAAEIIREKLMRFLGQEVPHELTVEIEKFAEKGKITHIYAIIYVEKKGQKAIVVGKDGARLKEIGHKARIDIEKLLDKKVYLQLWVKVKTGWWDKF